jgi:hypothetical protein
MLQVAQSTTGGPPLLASFMEAITQTFEVGAPLVFVLATGAAEGTAAGPVFLGIAMENGHNYAVRDPNSKVIVAVNTDDVVFQTVAKGAQLTDTSVGQIFNLIKDAALGWIIDGASAGTAGALCVCVGIGPYSPMSGGLQTLYFKFIASTRTPVGGV